jgi:hypothetical protein
MAYLQYRQVNADATVRTAAHVPSGFPSNATHVELQADGQNIRYTMDDKTDPNQTRGMLLLTTEPPKMFLIQDFRNIRFVRGAASNGRLNMHFYAGRDT